MTRLGSNNVHAMAASIEQLLQLNKALHLLPAPPTDNGRGEKLCNSAHSCPHLQDTAHCATLHCCIRTLCALSWCIVSIKSCDEQHKDTKIVCRHKVQLLLQKKVVTLNLLWHEGSVRILNNGSQGSCSCDSTQLVSKGQ